MGIVQIPLLEKLNAAISEAEAERTVLQEPSLLPEVNKLAGIIKQIAEVKTQLANERRADYQIDINTKLHSLQEAESTQRQQLQKLRSANANAELQRVENELQALYEERRRFLEWEKQQELELVEKKATSLGYVKAAMAEIYITLSFIPETTNASVLSQLSFLFRPFEWIPGLGVALIGMTTLWEIYETMLHKQLSSTKTAKILFSLTMLVLTVVAFMSPVGMALALGAAVIGIGVLKEGINYYVAHKELKQAEKELTAKKKDVEKISQLCEHNPQVYSQRKAYAAAQVECCEKQVELLRAAKVKVRNNLLITGVFILGLALLTFPPTSLAGAVVLGATLVGAISKKIYDVRKSKSIQSQEQATVASVEQNAHEIGALNELSMDVVHTHRHGHNSHADVYIRLPQAPPDSVQEKENDDVCNSGPAISPPVTRENEELPPSHRPHK